MDKKTYYIASSVGTAIGGFLPTLFGVDGLSGWSIIGGAIGGIGAIVLIYRLSQ